MLQCRRKEASVVTCDVHRKLLDAKSTSKSTSPMSEPSDLMKLLKNVDHKTLLQSENEVYATLQSELHASRCVV